MQEPIYVAGHRGMVGAAVLRRLHQENLETVTPITERFGSLRSSSGSRLLSKQLRRNRRLLCSSSRRNSRQQHFSRRVLLPELADEHQRYSCRLRSGCAAVPVLGKHMHLSSRLPAADSGIVAAFQSAGSYQRGIRVGKDRWAEDVSVLPQTIRRHVPLGHADQSIRTR